MQRLARGDHRDTAIDLFCRGYGEVASLRKAQELHFGRLADREQRLGAMRDVPFDQVFETVSVDAAVLMKGRDHDRDDPMDIFFHFFHTHLQTYRKQAFSLVCALL